MGGDLILKSLLGIFVVSGFNLVLEFLNLGVSALGVGLKTVHVLEFLRSATAAFAEDSFLQALVGRRASVARSAGDSRFAGTCKIFIFTRVLCHDCTEFACLSR